MDYKSIYLEKRNPTVSEEDWPRVWRSHPRFVSQFPVIGAAIQQLNYCSRVYHPTLDGKPFDPPGATRVYDGSAICASPSEDLHTVQVPPDIHARIMDDERRVFAELTPTCTLRGRETLVLGGAPGQAAVLRFLARKPGISREE